MMQRIFVVVAVIVSLASCATPQSGSHVAPVQTRVKVPDQLPDTLGDQGLLVATVAANAVAGTGFQQLSFSMASVQVDGVYYSNAVRNNYLVLPLKPGNYTLEALYVYRTVEDRGETRYPLQYKFRIVSGQATNVGLIALVRQKGDDKRYFKVMVDNSADMAVYLRKNYPKLAATLRPAAPVLATEIKYADANLLESLRRDVARDAWLFSDDPDTVSYAGGEVGTIARLLRDSQGKVAAFDILDTGTTAAMLSCSGYEQRFVCSSAEPALYFVEGAKVERRALPVKAQHVWVHAFPPRGLVLIDEKMTVYCSSDNGASWSKYAWAKRKEPLHPAARIKSTNGKNGYYLYSTFNADPLAPQVIYSEFSHPGYRAVDIPKMSAWQRLVETPQGLLVGPLNTDRKDDTATLYFRPAAQAEWQPRALPGKRCFYLQRDDRENMEKWRIFCDSKFFVTANAGRTWAERSVTNK